MTDATQAAILRADADFMRDIRRKLLIPMTRRDSAMTDLAFDLEFECWGAECLADDAAERLDPTPIRTLAQLDAGKMLKAVRG